jgi:hypothetical protein
MCVPDVKSMTDVVALMFVVISNLTLVKEIAGAALSRCTLIMGERDQNQTSDFF